MIILERALVEPIKPPYREGVIERLHKAMRLEHATIPPYLYALYSLDESKNKDVADVITNVVLDEMLHMVLVANVMNALGGSPQLHGAELLPIYPGPLPGAVPGLRVGLAPCSKDQIQNVFMKIEEPEKPLRFEVTPDDDVAPTIGVFYDVIIKALAEIDPSDFYKERNQIGPRGKVLKHAVVVTDYFSAKRALMTIVGQGEGTTTNPGKQVGEGWAHYYQFAEIANGRKLIKNPKGRPFDPPQKKWIYGGAHVSIDPNGVHPVPTDPKVADYKGDAQRDCRDFNYLYATMLELLHDALNGCGSEKLSASVQQMKEMRKQAQKMAVKGVGPTFEWQPKPPAA